ncbi:queuosine precursor transporter [Inquilinus sp. NPDC058860]|uniref:queuosine precursor transporter n=1 Tax=Inquilinus sp. NPDC058860 TaxID=3346652 RepID=UPI0036791B0A
MRTETRGMGLALIAMIAVVVASNYLVQFPINDWLTWGAFTYPVTFLVTDLTNRFFGPRRARQVAYAGFALAVLLSLWLADWRIAVASGTAFLVGQLLDIHIFDRLRRAAWWRAPFIGSAVGSVVDTAIFFTIAFAGTGLPILTLMAGDLSVKLACALLFLAPFRALMNLFMPMPALQNG